MLNNSPIEWLERRRSPEWAARQYWQECRCRGHGRWSTRWAWQRVAEEAVAAVGSNYCYSGYCWACYCVAAVVAAAELVYSCWQLVALLWTVAVLVVAIAIAIAVGTCRRCCCAAGERCLMSALCSTVGYLSPLQRSSSCYWALHSISSGIRCFRLVWDRSCWTRCSASFGLLSPAFFYSTIRN